MHALTVIAIGFAAGWIGFLVGVLFVCVIKSTRTRRHAPWQPPRDREVTL
jgi:hypothetical protein